MKLFRLFKTVLMEILFPRVCSLCGMPLSGSQQFICSNCVDTRFDSAISTKDDLLNLPESVNGRVALWKFDKGGYLQDLLHNLKYQRLTGVGIDLGISLAQKIRREMPTLMSDTSEVLLIPVPLHPKKRKMRGFNQAYYIAKGMAEVLGGTIISKSAVIRIKNTKTQTGFSLEKRRINIAQAFKVEEPEVLTGKKIVIVDDVFTTGATCFELAQVLKEARVESIYVVTVAQA